MLLNWQNKKRQHRLQKSTPKNGPDDPAHMLQSFTKFTLGCGKEQISFKRAKKSWVQPSKITKPEESDGTSHVGKLTGSLTETYQHNSKQRQNSTTANKDKFLNLRWQSTPWLLDNKVWDPLYSYPILLNLNSTLRHSPAAPPMPCCFQVQKESTKWSTGSGRYFRVN